jgi:hypothetical protein
VRTLPFERATVTCLPVSLATSEAGSAIRSRAAARRSHCHAAMVRCPRARGCCCVKTSWIESPPREAEAFARTVSKHVMGGLSFELASRGGHDGFARRRGPGRNNSARRFSVRPFRGRSLLASMHLARIRIIADQQPDDDTRYDAECKSDRHEPRASNMRSANLDGGESRRVQRTSKLRTFPASEPIRWRHGGSIVGVPTIVTRRVRHARVAALVRAIARSPGPSRHAERMSRTAAIADTRVASSVEAETGFGKN